MIPETREIVIQPHTKDLKCQNNKYILFFLLFWEYFKSFLLLLINLQKRK